MWAVSQLSMGFWRSVIEAKTFDIVVEKAAGVFKCSITEAGRGFFFSIFMGWEAASWLSNVLHAVRVGNWKDSSLRKCREKNKVFLAEIGKNSRGEFLAVTEFIQDGRRIVVKIPKGRGGKGWFYFGRALEDLLPSVSAQEAKVKFCWFCTS